MSVARAGVCSARVCYLPLLFAILLSLLVKCDAQLFQSFEWRSQNPTYKSYELFNDRTSFSSNVSFRLTCDFEAMRLEQLSIRSASEADETSRLLNTSSVPPRRHSSTIKWFRFDSKSNYASTYTDDSGFVTTVGNMSTLLVVGSTLHDASNPLDGLYLCKSFADRDHPQHFYQRVTLNEIEKQENNAFKLNYSLVHTTSSQIVVEMHSFVFEEIGEPRVHIHRNGSTDSPFTFIYSLFNTFTLKPIVRGTIQLPLTLNSPLVPSSQHISKPQYLVIEGLQARTNYTLLMYVKSRSRNNDPDDIHGGAYFQLVVNRTVTTQTNGNSNTMRLPRANVTNSFQMLVQRLRDAGTNSDSEESRTEDEYADEYEDESYDTVEDEYAAETSSDVSVVKSPIHSTNVVNCELAYGAPARRIPPQAVALTYSAPNMARLLSSLSENKTHNASVDVSVFQDYFRVVQFDDDERAPLDFASHADCLEQLKAHVRARESSAQILARQPVCAFSLAATWQSTHMQQFGASVTGDVSEHDVSPLAYDFLSAQISFRQPASDGALVFIASPCRYHSRTRHLFTVTARPTTRASLILPRPTTPLATFPLLPIHPRPASVANLTLSHYASFKVPYPAAPIINDCLLVDNRELQFAVQHNVSRNVTAADVYYEISVMAARPVNDTSLSDDEFYAASRNETSFQVRRDRTAKRAQIIKANLSFAVHDAPDVGFASFHFRIKVLNMGIVPVHGQTVECQKINKQLTDEMNSFSVLSLLMPVLFALLIVVAGLLFCLVLRRKYGLSPNYFVNFKNNVIFKSKTNHDMTSRVDKPQHLGQLDAPSASMATYQLQRSSYQTSSNNYLNMGHATTIVSSSMMSKNPTFNYNYVRLLKQKWHNGTSERCIQVQRNNKQPKQSNFDELKWNGGVGRKHSLISAMQSRRLAASSYLRGCLITSNSTEDNTSTPVTNTTPFLTDVPCEAIGNVALASDEAATTSSSTITSETETRQRILNGVYKSLTRVSTLLAKRRRQLTRRRSASSDDVRCVTDAGVSNVMSPQPPISPHHSGLANGLSYYSTTFTNSIRSKLQNLKNGPTPPMYKEDNDSIGVAIFEPYVQKMHVDGDFGFAQLYEEIMMATKAYAYTSDVSLYECNRCKNRYSNILTYDHSRVKLSYDEKDDSQGYINANYVDGYQKSNTYIATQGPMPNTFADFWKMIWEKNCSIVVMITNVKEKGRIKCDQYWPDDGIELYGNIQVTHLHTICLSFYTKRIFTIKLKNVKKRCNAERLIYQYHFTDWPDHGVPVYILPVLTFIKKSARANPELGGPIVVHCSAGVGRTGTYIVIDAMMSQIVQRQTVNIHTFLRHIRHQRNYLVQTEEQFIFIYDVLLEAIKSGETELTEHNYKAFVHALLRPANDNDATAGLRLIDHHFQLIIEHKPKDYQLSFARMPFNANKNRNPHIIPVNNSRVILSSKMPGIDGSEYINATYFHGCNRQDEFIVTQYPLDDTKGSFWQMVWDNNSTQIVVLNGDETEACDVFWLPLGECMKCDGFTVQLREETYDMDFVLRDFLLASIDEDYEFSCRMISACYWPESCAPVKATFELINKVRVYRAHTMTPNGAARPVSSVHHSYQQQQVPPIVVVDLFGGYRAATFCALFTFQDIIQLESSVNVYEVAKMFHLKRPDVWSNKNNILFLYEAVECLFDEMHLNNQFLKQNTNIVDNMSSAGVTTSQTMLAKSSKITTPNAGQPYALVASSSNTRTLPHHITYLPTNICQMSPPHHHLSNDAIGSRLTHHFHTTLTDSPMTNAADASPLTIRPAVIPSEQQFVQAVAAKSNFANFLTGSYNHTRSFIKRTAASNGSCGGAESGEIMASTTDQNGDDALTSYRITGGNGAMSRSSKAARKFMISVKTRGAASLKRTFFVPASRFGKSWRGADNTDGISSADSPMAILPVCGVSQQQQPPQTSMIITLSSTSSSSSSSTAALSSSTASKSTPPPHDLHPASFPFTPTVTMLPSLTPHDLISTCANGQLILTPNRASPAREITPRTSRPTSIDRIAHLVA